MNKDRWTAITIDDLRSLAKAGSFDLLAPPSADGDGLLDVLENPLGTGEAKADLLKELALCAVTKPPECFVEALEANMENLLRRSFMDEEVSNVLVEGLRLGVSKKCGASACMLGSFYYNGCFVDQDYVSAAELYELGMDWGSSQATINLGYIYEYGRIGERDFGKAYQCYSLAAALSGASEAIYKMGDLLSKGTGAEKNRLMAIRLWQRAWDKAPDNPIRAQVAIRLAPLYLEGDWEADISRDVLFALKLYQEAEIGLRQDIAKGLYYYEKRLAEAIEGQASARELLETITMRR